MDSRVDTPPGLFDRLRFVADMLNATKRLPTKPALLRRDNHDVVHATIIGTSITVGREAPSGLVIADTRISRQHFEITFTQGRHSIKDLSSRNGTWVNGSRITEIALKDGDIIEAGGTVWVFLSSKS